MKKNRTNPPSGLSRRSVLGAGAGAAAAVVLPSAAVAAKTNPAFLAVDDAWQPQFLDVRQGQMLGSLVDHLMPKTKTPSATEVGVHEYIDEALSVAESSEQLEFLGGLAWLDRRSDQRFQRSYLELDAGQQVELLQEISDDRGADGDASIATGAAFFTDLKARTLFGYYSSETGREVLGKPTAVKREKLVGCTHGPGGKH